MTCKSPHFFAILSISLILLVACSSISPSATAALPPPTATVEISVVEDLAQAFISAYESEQVTDYLALFSYDAIFMDNSTPFRNYVVADLVRNSRTYVNNLFKNTNFGMKLNSHFVSRDGRFVALTGTYTNTGKDGNPASVAIVIILEVKDGKIIREDQYYDNSLFYQARAQLTCLPSGALSMSHETIIRLSRNGQHSSISGISMARF
jgi:ketosteroid isomerase-like protein